MARHYFEDFQPGDTFDLGERTVAEAEIVGFARANDPQPFHLDAEAAKDSIYGGLIASGWHTASIFMRLLVDGLLAESPSQGSPGVDELRWRRPVRPGDTLRGRLTVLDVTPSRSRPTLGVVRSQGELFNQAGEVVLELRAVNFFERRTTNQ